MIDMNELDALADAWIAEKRLDKFKSLDLELARVVWQQGFLEGAKYGIDEIGKVLPEERT